MKKSIALYAAKWAVTTAVIWYMKNKLFKEKDDSSSEKTTIEVT